MKENEYDNFKRFMFRTYDACTAEKEPPSIGKVEMYFIALIDKSFEEVIQNTSRRLLRDNKFFPEICEIRGEDEITLEAKAKEDYIYIKRLVQCIYSPSPSERMQLIRDELNKKEKPHLIPIVEKWIDRFINDEIEGVLLSQFIKAYKSDQVIYYEKQLPLKTQKLIDGLMVIDKKMGNLIHEK